METGECFGSHASLAVEMCSRGGGVDGLEVGIAHKSVLEWLPEFTHGHVGMLVVLDGINGQYVACGRLVLHLHALLMCQVGHSAEEVLDVQVAQCPAPVEQEAAGGLRVVHHVAHQCGEPLPQGISCVLAKHLLHLPGPRLGAAFPTVHKHPLRWAVAKRHIMEMAHISGELLMGTLDIQFVTLPAGGLLWCRPVLAAAIDVANA